MKAFKHHALILSDVFSLIAKNNGGGSPMMPLFHPFSSLLGGPIALPTFVGCICCPPALSPLQSTLVYSRHSCLFPPPPMPLSSTLVHHCPRCCGRCCHGRCHRPGCGRRHLYPLLLSSSSSTVAVIVHNPFDCQTCCPPPLRYGVGCCLVLSAATIIVVYRRQPPLQLLSVSLSSSSADAVIVHRHWHCQHPCQLPPHPCPLLIAIG